MMADALYPETSSFGLTVLQDPDSSADSLSRRKDNDFNTFLGFINLPIVDLHTLLGNFMDLLFLVYLHPFR